MSDRKLLSVPILILLGLPIYSCIKVAVNLATPTAIERQMIGEYQQINEELLYAATVRSQENSAHQLSLDCAISARLHQSYNLDDILSLKEQGCLGESIDGKLASIDCLAIKKDSKLAEIQKRMIVEENSDRTIILEEIKKKNKLLKDLSIKELFLLNRQLLLTTAPENHLFEIQQANKRQWVTTTQLRQPQGQ